MPNLTIANVDTGSVVLDNASYENDTFTAAGAGTTPAGTILARATSSAKLIPYVKGGSTDGDGIPVAVLSYDVEATAAGDVSIRPLVGGEVRKQRLIIAADGDASNVDKVVEDLLRDYSIIAISVDELTQYDNQ